MDEWERFTAAAYADRAPTTMPSATHVESPPAPGSTPSKSKSALNAIGSALALLFLALALFVVVPGSPAKMVVVSGTSMEPWLHTGDLVVALRQGSYGVGDAVVYRAEVDGRAAGNVVHRIVAVNPDGTFVLQGDNKEYRDPWDVPQDWMIGEVVIMVPKAYFVLSIWRHPIFLATMAGLLLTMALWPPDPLKQPPKGKAFTLPPPTPKPSRRQRRKTGGAQ